MLSHSETHKCWMIWLTQHSVCIDTYQLPITGCWLSCGRRLNKVQEHDISKVLCQPLVMSILIKDFWFPFAEPFRVLHVSANSLFRMWAQQMFRGSCMYIRDGFPRFSASQVRALLRICDAYLHTLIKMQSAMLPASVLNGANASSPLKSCCMILLQVTMRCISLLFYPRVRSFCCVVLFFIWLVYC